MVLAFCCMAWSPVPSLEKQIKMSESATLPFVPIFLTELSSHGLFADGRHNGIPTWHSRSHLNEAFLVYHAHHKISQKHKK